MLYCPAGHTTAVALVDPGGHAYPAAQPPLHAADGRAPVDPKVPPGQATQAPNPGRLYVPATHATAVGLVEPAGHAYPALQLPVHAAADVKPAVKLYRPAAHAPLHDAFVQASLSPNRPAGHALQLPAPPTL